MNNNVNIIGEYEQARSLHGRGDYEQAQPYFEVALAQTRPVDEHALQLYWEYSLCLYQLGECAKALSIIEEGLSYYPDCRELFFIRGKIYYQIGLLDQSRVCFTKYIGIKTSLLNYPEAASDNSTAFWYLSLIYAHEGKTEEALSSLKLLDMENINFAKLRVLGSLFIKSGINIKLLIESLRLNKTINEPYLAQLLLKLETYEACLELINHSDKKYSLHMEWMQCQLHLGRYHEVQSMIDEDASLIMINDNLSIYYCISKWLQSPRQSAAPLLANSDHNSPYVQACLLMEEFIMEKAQVILESTELKNKTNSIIMKTSLELFSLGASPLALNIVEHFFSWNRIEAYRELGRKAFKLGCFQEAKTLLERSISHEGDQAEDYYRLGLASAKLGFYKQAAEYFLQAVALHPENPLYPCLVYESLAIHAIKILVSKSDCLMDNPQLRNELLRLCTLKRKSKRLRQLLLRSENNVEKADSGYNYSDIYYAVDDISEGIAWNINA